MQQRGLLKPGERIQPLALWALYTLEDGRNPNRSRDFIGTPYNLFRALNVATTRDDLCKESEFQSSSTKDSELFALAKIAEIKKFKDLADAPSLHPCSLHRSSLIRTGKEINNAGYQVWWQSIKRTCHTVIPRLTLARPIFIENRRAALVQNLKTNRTEGGNRLLSSKIDEALELGALPSIEYQLGFLLKSGKNLMHLSSIVQRRPLGDKCYYRLRNSFGKSCERYRHPERCEQGYLWVERDELLNHTDAVSYLNPGMSI